MTKERFIDEFDIEGKALYDKWEHLDPSPDGFKPWEELSHHERDFYCTLAEVVIKSNKRQPDEPKAVCRTCKGVGTIPPQMGLGDGPPCPACNAVRRSERYDPPTK